MFRNREVLLFTIFAAVMTTTAFVLCLKISMIAAIIMLIACLCIYAMCMLLFARRYRKISELSDYLQKLLTGRPAMDIRENSEGELSVLKNEIYRVAVSLTEQADALQKDKLELADALSDISHQLKTPLTSLGIMTDLLDTDDLPPEKRREFIDSIRTGQNRMEWLVLSLLKLARLDADAAGLKQQPIFLSALVEKASVSMCIPMEIKEQILSVDGNDASVICDPDWTVEAVVNILKNAVENTPIGGHIAVSYGSNPIYDYIEVRDTGSGIDRADLPHLFKRFYRGKNTGQNGAGIGLSMSLSIMRKQNGDIEAGSDNGGVFTIKFYRK